MVESSAAGAGSALERFATRRFVLELDQTCLDLEDLDEQHVLHAPGRLDFLLYRRDLPGHEILSAHLAPNRARGGGIEGCTLLHPDLTSEFHLALAIDDTHITAVHQRGLYRREQREKLIIEMIGGVVLNRPDRHNSESLEQQVRKSHRDSRRVAGDQSSQNGRDGGADVGAERHGEDLPQRQNTGSG